MLVSFIRRTSDRPVGMLFGMQIATTDQAIDALADGGQPGFPSGI
jgi:hypothetical protein